MSLLSAFLFSLCVALTWPLQKAIYGRIGLLGILVLIGGVVGIIAAAIDPEAGAGIAITVAVVAFIWVVSGLLAPRKPRARR